MSQTVVLVTGGASGLGRALRGIFREDRGSCGAVRSENWRISGWSRRVCECWGLRRGCEWMRTNQQTALSLLNAVWLPFLNYLMRSSVGCAYLGVKRSRRAENCWPHSSQARSFKCPRQLCRDSQPWTSVRFHLQQTTQSGAVHQNYSGNWNSCRCMVRTRLEGFSWKFYGKRLRVWKHDWWKLESSHHYYGRYEFFNSSHFRISRNICMNPLIFYQSFFYYQRRLL